MIFSLIAELLGRSYAALVSITIGKMLPSASDQLSPYYFFACKYLL